MSGPIYHVPIAELPASPARDRLAAAIVELDAAMAELSAAQQPATRLAAIIAEAARLEAELAGMQAADEEQLGAWLALNAADPRPEPSPAACLAKEQLMTIAGDAAAARTALPAAEQSFQRFAERVRALQRQRDGAVCDAAVDAARCFARDWRAALLEGLEKEAVLHGLRDELIAIGNRSDANPSALAAAAAVGDLIAATRRSAGVARNPAAGRRLLSALPTDARATL